MNNIFEKYTSRIYVIRIDIMKIEMASENSPVIWLILNLLFDYPSTKCICMSMFHATKKNVDPYYRKFWLDVVYFLLDNMTDFWQEAV